MFSSMYPRAAAAGAVLLCLAVSVAPVIAQGEVVTVTGATRCWLTGDEQPVGMYHGLESDEGVRFECAFEMSDPRVSGTQQGWFSEHCPPEGGDPCLLWGASVIEGPAGTWECSDIHMEPAPGFRP